MQRFPSWPSTLIQQITQIIIVPPALTPRHSDLLSLLLLLADSFQDLLQLLLIHLLPQLSASRKHNQSILDIVGA